MWREPAESGAAAGGSAGGSAGLGAVCFDIGRGLARGEAGLLERLPTQLIFFAAYMVEGKSGGKPDAENSDQKLAEKDN